MVCQNCGIENDAVARYCQACGDLLPLSPLSPAGKNVFTGTFAGFWKRLAALIIDAIVLSVAVGILSMITFGGGLLLAVLFGPWIYEASMLSSTWSATVGKKALSIEVTRPDGSRISFARATGRHFAKYISALPLLAGFMMVLFTPKKQALHDIIAETIVTENTGNR